MIPASNAVLHAAAEYLALAVGGESVSSDADGVIHVLPKNTQQISTILEYANKNGLTVDPRGGGTKQRWGRGTAPHIRLCLSSLNKVLDHPWQDLTCTVQAGCTWSLLQQNLAKHGQFVALDPLFGERATVGGILATNDSGALRHRYGSLRDLVIGMTLVLPDGTIARTGGKVVKNVAGYDLCKLLTASMGTLAIITEANFRLHPLPQYSRPFTVTASNAGRLASLLAAIRGSHLLVQSLQLRRNKAEAHLDICLSSHTAARQDALLEEMVRVEGLELKEANEASCCEREALFAGGSTVIRASTLPTNTCAFADELQRVAPTIDVVSISQGIGLHDVALRGSPDEITIVISQMRADQKVAVTVLQCGSGVDAQAFKIPTPVMSVMQAIKHNFDPEGVLGPGKFFANA
jgi:FAD/FMN-containing dehydrogenases